MIGALALAGAIAFTQGPGIATVAPGLRPHRITAVGWSPAWSPDGSRLLLVVRGDLRVMDADGTHASQLTQTAERETNPAWAPDGRFVAFDRDGAIWTIRTDGREERRIAPAGTSPTWSPDGKRIAYALDGELYTRAVDGGKAVRLTDGEDATDPAWSPDGRRIAYASDVTGNAEIHVLNLSSRTRSRVTYQVPADSRPAWSPDGRRLTWEREGSIWIGGADGTGQRRLATGTDPTWQPVPRHPELLPDLDQRPPAHLTVIPSHGGFELGFDTAVDNVGSGPFVIVGRRARGATRMRASQRVTLAGGRTRVYPDVGFLRYQSVGEHHHWHFEPYERYELRTADGALVVRDHKQGFCLADHYGRAPGKLEHRVRAPVFRDDCAWFNPSAMFLVEGSSVGYTDRYPAFFHGQSLTLTGVPAGVYVLVNRANPNLRFRELRYDNNAASRAIRIEWPNGPRATPRVTVLRTCRSETCPV